MKKILSLLIATVLLSVPTFAADIDITALSDTELVELDNKIQTELKIRQLDDLEIIQPGDYVVGVDIKEDSYMFTPVDKEKDTSYIFFYDGEKKGALPVASVSLEYGESEHVKLKDGQTVEFRSPFMVSHPKASWMPD